MTTTTPATPMLPVPDEPIILTPEQQPATVPSTTAEQTQQEPPTPSQNSAQALVLIKQAGVLLESAEGILTPPPPAKPKVAWLDYVSGPAVWATPAWQEAVSKYALVIVSWYRSIPRAQRQAYLDGIHSFNPYCRVLHYTIPQQVHGAGGGDAGFPISVNGDPPISVAAKLTKEKWWLYDNKGQTDANRVPLPNAPAFRQVNTSVFIPRVSPIDSASRTLADWWAKTMSQVDHLPGSGGFFIDNLVALESMGQLLGDWDHSFPVGASATAWRAVQKEIRQFYADLIRHVRETNPKAVIIANATQSAAYEFDWLNSRELDQALDGYYFEKAIGASWSTINFKGVYPGGYHSVMNKYILQTKAAGHYSIIGGSTHPATTITPAIPTLQAMRLILCTALLRDGYAHFFKDPTKMGGIEWYDEYDALIGVPIEPPVEAPNITLQTQLTAVPNLWLRQYTHGAVLVNGSSTDTLTVNISYLGDVYRRILGQQAPLVNDGQPVTQNFNLGPLDAIMLLKEPDNA